MPSADLILGDKRSCDALELVVVPRMRDWGDGFKVSCALPSDKPHRVQDRSLLVGQSAFCREE
jgi:hypothetical protein